MMCLHLVSNVLGCGCKYTVSCSRSVCGVRSELYHRIPRKYIYYHLGNEIHRILYSDYIKRKSLLFKQLNLFENEKD